MGSFKGREDLKGGLIVLPEMLATGFSMNVDAVTSGEPARTEDFLKSLAADTGACVVGGMGAPAGGELGQNICLAVSPEGNRLVEYKKIHPFTFGGESKHYEAGQSVELFEWGGMKICPFICYDLRFPEIFRAGVRRGAEVFCVIANWPNRREMHWVNQLQARAIENQAFVVGVNRCGTDPYLEYSGRSMIVDPHGEILADAGNGQTVVAYDLDLERVRDWRSQFPLLDDMRFVDDSN